MATILVVDDEVGIRELLSEILSDEGHTVRLAEHATAAREARARERPDLVLLDLMLPDVDGLEVCRRIRRHPELGATPIVMLTAKAEETDVVLGLGVGADDYVTKPFGVAELIARVKAVLRRVQPAEDEVGPHAVQRGPVRIDPARHEVTVDGGAVHFTATEFRLLHYLAARPGRVFPRDALLRHALGDDESRLDRNIDVHVRAIRHKLGAHRDLIETVRGVGYRFRDPPR